MGKTKHRDPREDHKDPRDDQNQSQDQDQKQANLQAQLQGQGELQGQGQGQVQLAVQSLDSKSENDNDNDNKNYNSNSNRSDVDNKLDNDVDNKVDNKLDNNVDNDLDNKVENRVENTVDNKVNVDVNVDLDLDLKADGLSSPVIDLHGIHGIDSSLIMPDVVDQWMQGNGNQFNIDQVNNLVDNDTVYDPKVTFYGGDSDFSIDAKMIGGDVKFDAEIGDVIGDSATGAIASADASLTQEAFTQTITLGANIQFNSLTMNVAGDDWSDDHSLG